MAFADLDPIDVDLPGPQRVGTLEADHLIIAFAVCNNLDDPAAMTDLPAGATALRQMIGRMRRGDLYRGEPDSLSPPHERALAQALGWPELADGLLPWAAEQAAALGLRAQGPWGQVSLCHWAMGREQASMSDTALLTISEAESLALMADMAPYFAADGLQLHHLRPGRWLAQGEPMDLPTASLDRVIGRDVDPWLPAGAAARLVRRLQGEMQMLLYTHPINEKRSEQRKLPINSLWFSGTGRLPTPAHPSQTVHLTRQLAPAAMAGDAAAHAQAWAELDRKVLQPLLARQQAGEAIALTLCGERGYLTLEPAPGGMMAQLGRLLRPSPWPPKEGL